jgi:hypothetical protein
MQLARGRKSCEEVFEHAIAIPLRTKEEEAVVEGTCTCTLFYCIVTLLLVISIAIA